MRIDELMPGDWVHCSKIEKDGYPANCRVVELSCGSICSDTAGIRIHPHVVKGVRASDISPIPLTPEILEKNGIEISDTGVHLPEDENLYLELSVEDGEVSWSININEYTVLPLKYVHELQHALKLCGIDKQITL